MRAGERWAEALAAWALPEEVLAAAPESPWGFPTQLFVDLTRDALDAEPTPTHRRVAEVLPADGVLLDVGCGAGAASLPAAPPHATLVAVDQDDRMLDALVALAGGIDVRRVAGRWPEAAGQVPVADVAVCANVAYNVADLAAFVGALDRHARRRVVLELSEVHPQTPLSPYWQHFWGLARPTEPTAEDAAAVVAETVGRQPARERWSRPRRAHRTDRVAWVRRRLCLPASADDEVAAMLREQPEPFVTDMVTLWWEPAAG